MNAQDVLNFISRFHSTLQNDLQIHEP